MQRKRLKCGSAVIRLAFWATDTWQRHLAVIHDLAANSGRAASATIANVAI